MITAWRKSATAPRGSLSRPSSNTCRNRSHTPGSAFSNSSSSTTENGSRRIRLTSDASPPKSSSPPSMRRALPGFWYSDRSIRIIRSPEPNRYSASDLAISVLPVPVGPTNSSTACGRVGSARPGLQQRDPLDDALDRLGLPDHAPGEERAQRVDVEPFAVVEQRQRQPGALGDRGQHVGEFQRRVVPAAPAHRRQQREQRAGQRVVAEEVAAERQRLAQHRAVGSRCGAIGQRERPRLVHRLHAHDVERVAQRRPCPHEPLVRRRIDHAGDMQAPVGHPRQQQVEQTTRVAAVDARRRAASRTPARSTAPACRRASPRGSARGPRARRRTTSRR